MRRSVLTLAVTLALITCSARRAAACHEGYEIVQVLFGGRLDYYRWSAIFAPQWMKVLAFVTIVSLLYHVWVGMRDIWMDYIKPVSIRLALDIVTIAWLVGCAGWAIQVLWRL